MKKYYAVKNGVNKGIFNTWDECSKQVIGFNGAEYKSFKSIEEANIYLSNVESPINLNSTLAYVDGSYNSKTEEYSFGGVLIINDKIFTFLKKYPKDELSKSRNVSGEIKGAAFIINYCINHDIKELDLYYDYVGIAKWYNGEWRANTDIAILYTEFVKKNKNKIKVNFHKIKSHSNNEYNDMADMLAKKALGI